MFYQRFDNVLLMSCECVANVFSRLRSLSIVRECVLFIGTQFSVLYTSVYPPAGAAYPRAWCL